MFVEAVAGVYAFHSRFVGGKAGVVLGERGALVMGILSSMLSGASYGTELGNMEEGPKPGQDGHLCAAIRVGAFEDVGRFVARVDEAIRQIHACRLAPGHERIYVPGEMEHLRRRAYLKHGIPLNRVELGDLAQVAEELGVDTSEFDWLIGRD
jgi:LDH2 family malate/lactate/ureidoglycolate dehydrogenase